VNGARILGLVAFLSSAAVVAAVVWSVLYLTGLVTG
jgi:hypothetical protein